MADNNRIQISILGGLEKTETQAKIQKQLDVISDNLKLDVKIDTSKISKDFKGMDVNLKESNLQLKNMSQEYKVVKGKLDALIKQTETYNSGLADTVKITQKIDAETGEVLSTVKTITNEEQKLADAMGKGREQAEKRRKASDRTTELAQAKAINKAKDEEYTKNLKLNSIITKSKNNLELAKIEAQRLTDQMQHYGSAEQRGKVKALNKVIQDMAVKTNMTEKEVNELNHALNINQKNLKSAGAATKSMGQNTLKLGDMIKTAVPKFIAWMGITAIFFAVTRAIKAGVVAVTELDTALVELKKVSDLNNASQGQFIKQSQKVGETVARTTQEIVQATSEFARMGFTVQESLDLAKQAAMLVNIGDGIEDITEASSTLIAVLKGFNLEASFTSDILDKLNEISNKYAVNTSDLATGIKRVSASMAAAGNNLDETLALLTGVVEVTRDASRSAVGLRTLSMRLRGVSENNKAIDGLTASLQGMFDEYGTGVQLINESTGAFNSTYDILVQLSKTWADLTDKQRANLTEAIAGKLKVSCLNVQKCA